MYSPIKFGEFHSARVPSKTASRNPVFEIERQRTGDLPIPYSMVYFLKLRSYADPIMLIFCGTCCQETGEMILDFGIVLSTITLT